MSGSKKSKRRSSTLAALLEDKPKRGRPRRNVSRQNVYVALSRIQKEELSDLVSCLPKGIVRADLPDLAIAILAARLEALRRDVSDRDREIPEGITDMESLYLLWDLPLPANPPTPKWTSIRVSPQQVIELGRAHGLLNAVFGVNRSQTFSLGLALLGQFLRRNVDLNRQPELSLSDLRHKIHDIYL
jgi:hypothetical protein